MADKSLPGSRSHTPAAHAAATTVAQEVSGSRASASLQIGTVYSGIISEAFGDQGVYHVELTNPKLHLPNCRSASQVFCQLLGIQDSSPLPKGTGVVVLYAGTSFILGCTGTQDVSAFPKYPLDPDHVSPNLQSNVDGGSTNPVGILEGERDMTNVLGVGVQLLTSMARLKAGDRAAVEAFMQDDLVRIMSENFQQFSAFGEHMILRRNGRIDVVWKGTGYDHESWGQLDENTPKADLEDQYSVKQKAEEGRWRFRAYMGHLGDFLNMFVQDPETALGEMAQRAAGKFRVHIGQDGNLLCQSVTDIVLESVYAIPLPVQIADLDNEEEAKKVSSLLDVEHLKICKALEQSRADMPALAYHLREYARWLSQAHGWQRFLQRDSAFTIESELDSMLRQAPTTDCGEMDKKKAGAGRVTLKTYATIRIFRDGCIMLYEGFGSSVIMSKGSFRVSAREDIELEAARDIRMRAGGNIFLCARRNIELSALTGSFVATARTAWRALCTWGGVHIRSDRDDENLKSQADQPNGDQDPRVETSEKQPGILLETLKSRLAAGSKRADIHTKEGGVAISSKGPLWLNGFTEVSAIISKSVSVRVPAFHFIGKFLNITFSQFLNLGQRLIITRKGVFSRAAVFVAGLVSRGAIEGPAIGPQPPATPSPIPVGPHLNHILENTREDTEQQPDVTQKELTTVPPTTAEDLFLPESHPWNMMPASEHPKDVRIQSPAQSDLDLAGGGPDYGFMTHADTALDLPRMGDNRVPFLGPAARQHWSLDSEMPDMNAPCPIPPAQLNEAAKGRMRVTDATFFYRKS